MWLFTTIGFFSIVEKDGPEERPLCIRARRKEDLEKFLSVIEDKNQDIIDTSSSDYRYRTYISRKELSRFFDWQTKNLNYSNFKNACEPMDDKRKMVYFEVWAKCCHLQEGFPSELNPL